VLVATEKDRCKIEKIREICMFDIDGAINSMVNLDSVLWFSRGWGKGHAIPDIAIAEALEAVCPEFRIQFVSYGTGASTFKNRGFEVIDLDMPDNCFFLESVVRCGQVLSKANTPFVVSHEETAAVVAAEVFHKPSLFITDFFQEPSMLTTRALDYAAEIIFIGQPGLFTEPPALSQKITYVGPAVRPLKYRLHDRDRARSELGISTETKVVSCLPGSWQDSAAPIFDFVLRAYQILPQTDKQLYWIAGKDYEQLLSRAAHIPSVNILQEIQEIDRLMVASDVVITKGTRTTLGELHALGVPSISLSQGSNWPDDVAAAKTPTNKFLSIRGLSPKALAENIELMMLPRGDQGVQIDWPAGVERTAMRLALRHREFVSR
jgi:UDP-N-acetylglucosamine:LPS N-acetylglucosamine transferase